MEAQAATEDSQNKGNISDSRGFIVLQTQLSLPAVEVNKSFFILNKAKCFR